jgi:hypothetical protein
MPKQIPRTGRPSLAGAHISSFRDAKFFEAVEKSPTPGRIMASACLSCDCDSTTTALKPTFSKAHLML